MQLKSRYSKCMWIAADAKNSIIISIDSLQLKEWMLVSLSLVYWLFTIVVPIPSKQQQRKHVMTLSVFKNVRILIFGATGSAANVLRAPGSTVK